MKSSVLTPAATFALSFNVMDGRLRWIALAARLFLLVNAEFPKAEGHDEVFKNRLFHLSARGFKNHPTAAAQKGSDLENPTSTAAAESSSTGLIIGIVIAILSVLILIGIALGVYFFILKKKKTTASAPEDPEIPGEKTPANAKSPPKSSKKEESKMTSSGKTTASAKDKKSADTTELVNNDAHSKFAASFNGFKTVE
ncbi:hypothetical protein L596_022771 [Steinernema carpocapsae]|uniref:Uncharacterized protein n=1 Tax=Steinernema carpocapsae TaxID=34508 RepID=A0A4U5MMS8_STECR|nr:hypothetical protein L596_022771 [Steinernema carpocapsae]